MILGFQQFYSVQSYLLSLQVAGPLHPLNPSLLSLLGVKQTVVFNSQQTQKDLVAFPFHSCDVHNLLF